ncbi:glycine zipper family protein [Catellatospora sp. IY07-71]|uniref:glycine zipper family protein n=1 Tax=Catellatospora sp. IY07-71 TaxID=2728827 RepID=UPI001BB349EA|nr:glycine zipper family protein [Catellatospora sp. IY07-71]
MYWAGVGSAGIQVGAVSAAAGWLLGPVGAVAGGALAVLVAVPYGWAVVRVRAYPATPRGVGLFAVDHSWSLVNTIAGAAFLAANLARGHRLDPLACRHRGRINIFEQAVRGYATTVGNVVAGANARCERHEDVHVRQARLFGPLYLPLIAVNYVLFSVLPVWWLVHDHAGYPITGAGRYFTHGVYHHVWHEAWAYRRDVHDRHGPRSGVPRAGRRARRERPGRGS